MTPPAVASAPAASTSIQPTQPAANLPLDGAEAVPEAAVLAHVLTLIDDAASALALGPSYRRAIASAVSTNAIQVVDVCALAELSSNAYFANDVSVRLHVSNPLRGMAVSSIVVSGPSLFRSSSPQRSSEEPMASHDLLAAAAAALRPELCGRSLTEAAEVLQKLVEATGGNDTTMSAVGPLRTHLSLLALLARGEGVMSSRTREQCFAAALMPSLNRRSPVARLPMPLIVVVPHPGLDQAVASSPYLLNPEDVAQFGLRAAVARAWQQRSAGSTPATSSDRSVRTIEGSRSNNAFAAFCSLDGRKKIELIPIPSNTGSSASGGLRQAVDALRRPGSAEGTVPMLPWTAAAHVPPHLWRDVFVQVTSAGVDLCTAGATAPPSSSLETAHDDARSTAHASPLLPDLACVALLSGAAAIALPPPQQAPDVWNALLRVCEFAVFDPLLNPLTAQVSRMGA
jgi:hypothetical protein